MSEHHEPSKQPPATDAPKRGGRPRLPAHQRRDHRIMFRVSAVELAALVELADGDSPHDAARRLALWGVHLSRSPDTARAVRRVLDADPLDV